MLNEYDSLVVLASGLLSFVLYHLSSPGDDFPQPFWLKLSRLKTSVPELQTWVVREEES